MMLAGPSKGLALSVGMGHAVTVWAWALLESQSLFNVNLTDEKKIKFTKCDWVGGDLLKCVKALASFWLIWLECYSITERLWV